MKLALLGADAESLELVRWGVGQGGHVLVAAYDGEPFRDELRSLASHVRLEANWEELLLGSAADAVIVGRGGKEAAAAANQDPAERRADQLRKLVQAAVPLIVVCPACEAIVGFEIEMIRSDTKAVVVPYVPGELNPAIQRLEEIVSWGSKSPIGSVEQILLEREDADRSREAVLVQLARDATLLRHLVGTIQTVAASGPVPKVGRDPMGPKVKELPSLANLCVYFGGDEGLTARWSIGPTLGKNQGRLTVIGQSGKAVLSMPAANDWSLDVSGEVTTFDALADLSEAEQVFRKLSHAIATDDLRDDRAWLAACRDQEAAEAVDRSLARGRTIELFNEEHTEEQSFKGVMAMGGCLTLVAALGVVLMVSLVEALQLPIRGWLVWRLWPVYLLVPIGAFLLMQFLQLAIKRDGGELVRQVAKTETAS